MDCCILLLSIRKTDIIAPMPRTMRVDFGEGVKQLGAGLGIVRGFAIALHGLDGGEREETGRFLANDHTDEGDARKVASQIFSEPHPVGWVVQYRVNVMKNIRS